VLFPFVSLTASAWLTNEVLNPILLAGAAFVLAGAAIGILTPARHRLVQPQPVIK
jgi:drug/metabolite transporter (DMT)-like permease